MSRRSSIGLSLLALLIVTSLGWRASAQSATSNVQYQVANLVADVRLLDERLRQMSNEMENLRRENARLKELVQNYESNSGDKLARFVTVEQLNAAIRKAVEALEARDDLAKKEVINEVSKRIEDFWVKVSKALDGVAQGGPPKDSGVKTVFSEDGIPKKGVPYKVAPGDSIASIAKKLNSRIDWIQNINKISNPKLLQVGQVIFVPQEEE